VTQGVGPEFKPSTAKKKKKEKESLRREMCADYGKDGNKAAILSL
jgi:hypothetical protein